MSTYCEPIRPTDWHEQEEDSWYEINTFEIRTEIRLQQALSVALAEVATEPSVVDASLEAKFAEHAEKWQVETAHISSPTQKMMHPSYQAILGMGKAVVPLLLRDLQRHRRSWFGALSYITKENPISRSDAGKMDKMIEAWVTWGRKAGLL